MDYTVVMKGYTAVMTESRLGWLVNRPGWLDYTEVMTVNTLVMLDYNWDCLLHHPVRKSLMQIQNHKNHSLENRQEKRMLFQQLG